MKYMRERETGGRESERGGRAATRRTGRRRRRRRRRAEKETEQGDRALKKAFEVYKCLSQERQRKCRKVRQREWR